MLNITLLLPQFPVLSRLCVRQGEKVTQRRHRSGKKPDKKQEISQLSIGKEPVN